MEVVKVKLSKLKLILTDTMYLLVKVNVPIIRINSHKKTQLDIKSSYLLHYFDVNG